MSYFQQYPVNRHAPTLYYNHWQNPYYPPAINPLYSNNHSHFYNQQTHRTETLSSYGLRKQNKVDITIFEESLVVYKQLLHDADLLLNHLSSRKQFATQVMSAAQISNKKEVDRLIKSIGIKSNIKVSYNPDGIHFTLWSDVKGEKCCQLDMAIRWQYMQD